MKAEIIYLNPLHRKKDEIYDIFPKYNLFKIIVHSGDRSIRIKKLESYL